MHSALLFRRAAAFVLGTASLTACPPPPVSAQEAPLAATPWPANSLAMPPIGAHRLAVISPTVLELELVTTKAPDPAPVTVWDFSKEMPAPADFEVTAGGKAIGVKRVGFKRRPLYAPLKKRDLRIGNWLYLELDAPLPAGVPVTVKDRNGTRFPAGAKFETTNAEARVSPALHVAIEGFDTDWPKTAFVGYYLGSLGELPVEGANFQLLDAAGKSVFSGPLKLRADKGWASAPYQKVLEADFTAFKTPGTYRLAVAGLGVSRPFPIAPAAPAMLARTYAQGLYNQRCGAAVELPFSRFAHAACHTAPAEVPTMESTGANRNINAMSAGAEKNPQHTAPRMADVKSSLYPFVKSGKIDVSGGHHDAGDYSVYTTNSAQLIAQLCLAADAFPGAGDLDNLGIPESGNGKSDLLEEAKWEADYLLKMQDEDGGFFFLKYPRERKYEDNVLPDAGDPQIVFPKNTAVTASATAALAQMASSPRFKAQYPAVAAAYRTAALRGWQFLETAVAKNGRDGAYQKVSHYGDLFGHSDELAWAAVQMFLLTGDAAIQTKWLADFDPTAPAVKRWGWWSLFEGYGCAIRSYAFAPQTGRAKETALDAKLLRACRSEILAAAQSQLDRAKDSAYGTSFPMESKRQNASGWYFSPVNAFELASGFALDPKPEFLDALLTNMNFEWGANPQNVPFITGVGATRQRDIVSQYAQNDRRVLPPSGIPQGNIVGGFAYLDPYKREVGQLTFPFDGDAKAPYAQMDRWADSFNVTTEFVVSQQAYALGAAAFLMGRSPSAKQPWRTAAAQITGVPATFKAGQSITLGLTVPGLDISQAQVVWEARGYEPVTGPQFTFQAANPGPVWVEAEALWPDGRRVSAAAEFLATPTSGGKPAVKADGTVALMDFDAPAGLLGYLASFKGTSSGTVRTSAANIAWMEAPKGQALQFQAPLDFVEIPLGQLPADFSLSARLYLEKVAYGGTNGGVLAISSANPNEFLLGLSVNKYPKPLFPELRVGNDIVLGSAALEKVVLLERWQRWEFSVRGDRCTASVDGVVFYDEPLKNPAGLRTRLGDTRLQLGRVTGWVDDVVVTGSK